MVNNLREWRSKYRYLSILLLSLHYSNIKVYYVGGDVLEFKYYMVIILVEFRLIYFIKYYNNKLRSVLVTPVSRIKQKYGAVVISMFNRFMTTDITVRK